MQKYSDKHSMRIRFWINKGHPYLTLTWAMGDHLWVFGKTLLDMESSLNKIDIWYTMGIQMCIENCSTILFNFYGFF